MKKISIYRKITVLALAFLALAGCCAKKTECIKAASFNVRFAPTEDSSSWPVRKAACFDLVRYHDFDVFGIQEAFKHQLEFLAGDDYAYVGVGRDDGAEAGEFSPVLYKKSRFDLVKGGTFWLSQTPEKPSKGWDAACFRVCSWAILRDKTTKREFVFMNTHLDHRGDVSRQKSVALLMEKAKTIAEGRPFVITGDFNLNNSDKRMAPLFKGLGVNDAKYASLAKPYGPNCTFHEYTGTYADENLGKPATGATPNASRSPEYDGNIDHIFVSQNITVRKFGVITDRISYLPQGMKRVGDSPKEGENFVAYPSDHFPIEAVLEF